MIIALLAAALAAQTPASAAHTGCSYTGGSATLPVQGRPFAAEPSADGCWLFVSLANGDRSGGMAVFRNDGARFVLARTVPLPAPAFGVALSHDGASLAVAAQDAALVLDLARLTSGQGDPVVGRIPEGAGAGAIYTAIGRDDGLLFVAEERANRLTVIDFARGRREGFGAKSIVGRIPQGGAPVGLALSPDGGRLFATSEVLGAGNLPTRCKAENGGREHAEGALAVIDVAKAATDPAHALIRAVLAGCNPVRVALSPDGRSAYVTARGENAVYRFDAASLARDPSVAVGPSPVGVAVEPNGRVWVSDSDRFSGGPGKVQTVPLSPGEAARSVGSGRFPRDLRVMPDGSALLVAVFGDQAVQVIPLPPR